MRIIHNRRRFGKISLIVCFLALPVLHAQPQDYGPLLGIWDVETEGGQYQFVFTFSLEDGNLTGTFEGQSGETAMQDLKYEDNRVTFTVEIDAGGQTMVIDFEATVTGDSLEGMLALEFGEAAITGTKRK
jgi:hypothetical protein